MLATAISMGSILRDSLPSVFDRSTINRELEKLKATGAQFNSSRVRMLYERYVASHNWSRLTFNLLRIISEIQSGVHFYNLNVLVNVARNEKNRNNRNVLEVLRRLTVPDSSHYPQLETLQEAGATDQLQLRACQIGFNLFQEEGLAQYIDKLGDSYLELIKEGITDPEQLIQFAEEVQQKIKENKNKPVESIFSALILSYINKNTVTQVWSYAPKLIL